MQKRSPFKTNTLASLIAVSIFGLTGCGGGGSSSDNDNDNAGSPDVDQTTQEMAAVSMVFSAMEMADSTTDMAGSMTGMGSVASITNHSLSRPKAMEQCPNGGSLTYNESGNSYSASASNCKIDMGSMSMLMNGGMNVSVQAGTPEHIEAEMNAFRMRISQGSEYMDSTIDGNYDMTYAAWNNFDMFFDMSIDMEANCQGRSASTSIAYNNFQSKAEPVGSTYSDMSLDGNVTVNASGAPAAINGSYQYETLEKMLFSQSGEHPTEGKLKISGPVSATVEFVQGGVYLNGTFYTWDEIEEKTEDEFGDDMFPECNFS